ncbi:TadE/TadG family type IV pilus assembly protein [Neoroseomonas terrae]|uniref:TadE/TadG family type IV pilus assembly protein n=1 Tax=Neoroseomonas terrae TaxID=424799 RepID=UPI001BA8CEFD
MALEFALVVPLFFIVVLATTDLIRLFRAQLRAETIAVQIGQIVSQCRTITTPGDRDNFWAHAQRIAGGIIDVNSATGGAVIISAVSRTTGSNPTNRLSWQMRTGNVTQTSRLGTTVNGTATVSDGFVVPANQTLLVTEVFAFVQPFPLSAGLIGTVTDSIIYGTTLFLSRTPNAVSVQTTPTNSATPDCTA